MVFLSEHFLYIYAGHIAFWLNILWKILVCNMLQSEHSCNTGAVGPFSVTNQNKLRAYFFFQKA